MQSAYPNNLNSSFANKQQHSLNGLFFQDNKSSVQNLMKQEMIWWDGSGIMKTTCILLQTDNEATTSALNKI